MSWLFSRALVEGFLGDTSSDGEPSVQLSVNGTQQAYLFSDKTMDSFRHSRYGMTLEPLTEDVGGELLTWFLVGFLAKTSAQQGKVEALMEADQGCGQSLPESLAKFHPGGYWLKTSITYEPKVLDEFSKTWPSSGMMLRGECYRLKTVEPITSGNECGLSESSIPTPTCSDAKFYGHSPQKRIDQKRQLSTAHYVQMFPTPTAHNAKEGGYPAEGTRNTPTLGWVVGGKINPQFTEWMMGWPIGWTDLKPLEMDKFHLWQQQHPFS